MNGSDVDANLIEVDRYIGSDVLPRRWEFRGDEGAWSATGPEGPLPEAFPDVTTALLRSGACMFERGAALDIRIPQRFDPFSLLPALASWTDSPVSEPDDGSPDWSNQPRIDWIQRSIEDQAGYFDLDDGRLIRINDLICGVHLLRDDKRTVIGRHLVLFQPDDPLWPVFFDRWASTSTDNEWGSADYAIGEITPGFAGEVRHVHGHDMDLWISRLPDDHPRGLYDEMVSWVTDIVSVTYGFEDSEALDTGDSVDVELREGVKGKVDTSSFGPTVIKSRGLE